MEFESFVLAAALSDLDKEPAAREHADAVEFRLDLAEEPLAHLADYDGELPIIATNRVEWEGGEAADTTERLETLSVAAEHPMVEAVDIELSAIAADGPVPIDHVREHGATVIVSVHDFEETPGIAEMKRLLSQAGEYGDIAKLAVTAATREDVLKLLSVTHSCTESGQRIATMAMGEAGRHSRAVAPVYGSKIGYAPVDPTDATAPGQYDLATLRTLVNQLSRR